MRGLGRRVRINQLDLIRQRRAGADDWCRARTYHGKLRWEVVPHTPDTASAGWKEGLRSRFWLPAPEGVARDLMVHCGMERVVRSLPSLDYISMVNGSYRGWGVLIVYRPRNISTRAIRRVQRYSMMIVKSTEKEIHYKNRNLYISIFISMVGGYLDTKSKNENRENVHHRAKNRERMRNINREDSRKVEKRYISGHRKGGKSKIQRLIDLASEDGKNQWTNVCTSRRK